MKLKLAAGVAAAGAIFFAISYQPQDGNLRSLLIGLAGNLLVLSLGLVIVNQYLENKARKSAVRALLAMTRQYIGAFHNHFLTACWGVFGRDAYGKIGDEYVESGCKPDALSLQVRGQIYELYKANSDLQSHLIKLEESLIELSRMAGWSLDPSIIESCLRARLAISKLRETALDGTDEAKTSVTEHLLDTDMQSGLVLAALMTVAGLDPKSVVG